MRWLVFPLGGILGAEAGQPVVVSGGTLVTIVVALLGFFSLAGIVAWLRYRKLAGPEREGLISEAAERAVKSMRASLEQRERDLEAALGRIAALEQRVVELDQEIKRLQGALGQANGERDRVQRRLDDALRERSDLESQIAVLQEQVNRIDPDVPG